LWLFEKVDTIRKTIIQRAGRLTKPNGQLTLTINAGPQLKERLLRHLDILSNST
jgi:16S rRNA G1207 methylase RsmC